MDKKEIRKIQLKVDDEFRRNFKCFRSLVTPIIFTTRAFVTNLIVVVQFLRYYLMTI